MKVTFYRKFGDVAEGKAVRFNCDYVEFGGSDGKDLYAVTFGTLEHGAVCINKNLVARAVYIEISNVPPTLYWKVVDSNLLWHEDYFNGFYVDPDEEIKEQVNLDNSARETYMFEVGWERGYSQGFKVGQVNGAERAANILSGARH